mmetsp:Transcript_45823/g.84018  ORF Transcript_45823/g.84018 Transcript_45823/m.84018 type:complete len:334 (+) Transcript_45823:49-1050(+)
MILYGAAAVGTAGLCFLVQHYRRYCKKAFAYYLRLLDSELYDGHIAEMEQLAKNSIVEVKNQMESSSLPAEIDVVISGGGFKVCYAGGIVRALQDHGVKVTRYAGCSAGAQIAFLLATGQLPSGVRWMHAVADTFQKFPYVRPAPLWDFFYRRAARLAGSVPEPGTFAVSITEVVRWLPPVGYNHMIVEFSSVEDVGDALMATAGVPLLTGGLLGRRFRGLRVLDGGLTDNCPKFPDAPRPQLVITWDGLAPHWHGRMCGLHFTAVEMRELVAMGIKDGCRLLQGEDVQGLSLIREPPPSQDKHARLGAFLVGMQTAYTMRGADVAADSLSGA